MIRFVERSRIPASPERVWEWFSTIEGHYLDWHPEHIEWRNIKGLPTKVGSTVFFDEWLGWFRLPMRCKIPEVRVGRYWRYEGTFPWSVVRAGGSFELVPVGEESDLVAEVHLGWPVPVLGPIVDFAIHAIFPKHHLRRHMTEEGHNLAAILSDSGFEAHQIWESSDA